MNEGLHNFAVYFWSCANRWVSWGRYDMPGAVAKAGQKAIVIDLVTQRVVYRRGRYCDCAKPAGIHSLPAIETYQP